ncbi:MAG: glucosamine-6-phosphate deaminase [Oscillospiraceae bacterium]|nr:glucosamine-6-phosphate deaminase [Oscillospiraceae bacterium]
MQIHIYDSLGQIGVAAGLRVAAMVAEKPDCVLGLATGSTPLPLYNELVRLYNDGIVDFGRVRTFNLDEYAGIDISHEQSYHRFMADNLFSKININPANTRIPNPSPQDIAAECAEYDAAIESAGGIDLQILGIGGNGHIAFNEPGSVFPRSTHLADLTEDTIEANKRFFASADDVPKKALTMGIGSIMKARSIIIIATGRSKAKAVKQMTSGDVTPLCPASVLQFHPCVTVILDREAAELL